jgi:hypothetical protein
MLLNKNLRIHNIHTLGSPPPTLPCPYCPRHFRSKGGRNKHIRAKHDFEGLDPHEPSPSESQQLSSNESYHERAPSPIPSDPMRSPSPLPEGSNADYDIDVDHPVFNSDYTPPGSYVEELNRNSPPGGHVHDEHVPRVTRAYHPKLDGKSLNIMFLYTYTNISCYCRADLRQGWQ